MAGPTDPAGRTEPSPIPDPVQWQRKHRPDAHEEAPDPSVNGRLLLALLGGVVSTVLGVAGFVNALDSGQPVANAPRRSIRERRL